jgi:hypothetical protein
MSRMESERDRARALLRECLPRLPGGELYGRDIKDAQGNPRPDTLWQRIKAELDGEAK